MNARHAVMFALLVAAPAARLEAQESPFFGSVPQGTPAKEPVALSLKDAAARALQFNLGLLLQDESARVAHGARWTALAGNTALSAMIVNSSPPSRHTESAARTLSRSRRATSFSTRSPISWPCVSLICLSPSRSTNSRPTPCFNRAARTSA